MLCGLTADVTTIKLCYATVWILEAKIDCHFVGAFSTAVWWPRCMQHGGYVILIGSADFSRPVDISWG